MSVSDAQELLSWLAAYLDLEPGATAEMVRREIVAKLGPDSDGGKSQGWLTVEYSRQPVKQVSHYFRQGRSLCGEGKFHKDFVAKIFYRKPAPRCEICAACYVQAPSYRG